MRNVALSTRFFLLVALSLMAAMMIGCGSAENIAAPSDDGISWDDDGSTALSGKTPVVAIVKTTTTRAGKTEASYHFETDMLVEEDLLVALQIQTGDTQEGALFAMREGENESEAFSFGEHITSVQIRPHKDLLDFEVTKMALINTGVPPVDLSLYPVQNRKYEVNTDNASVSR